MPLPKTTGKQKEGCVTAFHSYISTTDKYLTDFRYDFGDHSKIEAVSKLIRGFNLRYLGYTADFPRPSMYLLFSMLFNAIRLSTYFPSFLPKCVAQILASPAAEILDEL